jgi:hypothetical protein
MRDVAGSRRKPEARLLHLLATRWPPRLKDGGGLPQIVSTGNGRQKTRPLVFLYLKASGQVGESCRRLPLQHLQRHGGGIQHMAHEGVGRVAALGP